MGFCHGVLTNSQPLNELATTYAARLKICLSPRLQYESPWKCLKRPVGPASGDARPRNAVNELLICAAPGRRWRCRSARDALDLADRIILAVDRQQRRRLGEVDRIDHALNLRGYGHRIARAVGGGRGQLVLAVRPLRAVIAFAVPGEGLVLPGLDGVAVAVDGLPGAAGDGDADVGVGGNAEAPGGRTVAQSRGAA